TRKLFGNVVFFASLPLHPSGQGRGKIAHSPFVWSVVSSRSVTTVEPIRLGENLELDLRAYELRRSGKPLKLERIPMELLLLLVEQGGQVVSREQILARIWGKDVSIEADNSINAAIRKIRQALRDDPERPRFVQTITGRGYRFIARVRVGTVSRPEAVLPP